jgi:ribosome-binding protein aMBF1 (putative translation factor)
MDPNATCELCGKTTHDCWQLADDREGIPLCGDCLLSYEWVETVARTQYEIKRHAQTVEPNHE